MPARLPADLHSHLRVLRGSALDIRVLGLRFNNWIVYWTATIALIVQCVYMGRAWLAVKPRLRALAGLATAWRPGLEQRMW